MSALHLVSVTLKQCACTYSLYPVFKEKDMAGKAAKQPPKPEGPTYVAVVGEEEPELKFVGTKETAKKKTDPTQNATDDMHFDRYRKKFRH